MADNKRKDRDGADHPGEEADEYFLKMPAEETTRKPEARVRRPGEESARSKAPADKQAPPTLFARLDQNPNLLFGVAVGGVVLIGTLLAGLWLIFSGSGQKAVPTPVATTNPAATAPTPQPTTSQPPPQQATPQPAAQVAQTSPAVQTPPADRPPEQRPSEPAAIQPPKKEPAGSPDATAPAAKPPRTPLADDVATWKKEDYVRARQENSPLLLKAVEQLGRTAHSDAAAEDLADLLKRQSDEPFAPNPEQPAAHPPHNPADVSKLVETLVIALGNNGSKLAGQTLEQILEGRLATDDDKMAVEAALRTLAAHPGEENDAVLLRAMTAAEALRPADRQGAWPARDLRLKALELLKPAGPGDVRGAPGGPAVSAAFRTKLGEAVADRFEKFDPQDPIRDYFLAADPLSCDGQIAIYVNANTSKDTRARLEQHFANYSSTALNRLMGLVVDTAPSVGVAGGPPPKPADADFDPLLVTSLWSDRFQAAFDPQLDDLRSWEKQPQTILLASTIPQDSTRIALCKTLRKHQIDGPKALETAGWIDRMTTDPGLLVIIKLLSRKESKTGPGQPANPLRGPVPAAGNKAETPRQASQRKLQAEQDWMAFCSKLVTAWCRRLGASLAVKEKLAAEAGQSLTDAKLKLPGDIELDTSAKVTSACHLVWPDDMSSIELQQKPGLLDLYYVRAVETGRMKRATIYYNRQAKSKLADARTIDKGVWIEGLRPSTSQSDHRRSLDVVITRTDEKPADATKPDVAKEKDKDEEEADLVIEILSIEIKDPMVHE